MSHLSAEDPRIIDRRFFVERCLGRGGMGVVYLAREEHLDRMVALKLLHPSRLTSATAGEAFRREAAIHAALRSPNVAAVYAFGEHEGSYYLALEYVDGQDLGMIIATHAAHGAVVPTTRTVAILRDILRGLGAAHARSVVHGDVKPANIVIERESGRPVVVDFGLAQKRSEGRDLRSTGGGTPAFMAPEQAVRGGMLTPRSDIYSLGCVAFELLTGRLPFLSRDANELRTAHAMTARPRLSSVRNDLAPFDTIVSRMMAIDPASRPGDAAGLATDLDAALGRWLEVTAEPTVPPPSEVRAKAKGLRVLVIDDDPAMRRLAARAAQLAFFGGAISVSAASSGAEAIEHAAEAGADLVLLDYDMPGMDGIETLSRIRALAGGTDSRVLVISAKAKTDERWRFSVLGVNHFMEKPVDLAALVAVIQGLGELAGWKPVPENSRASEH